MGLGCSEMEKIFIMESKIFIFSILDGASRLRVGEKRIFSGEIVISSQCSEWFALTMEILLGYPKDQEFIKSFREGSKIVITRRGSNQAGRFLEVAVFGLGGRKWFILIPEGRGGWGWIKFSDDMRKAATFFFLPKWIASLGLLLCWSKTRGRKKSQSWVWLTGRDHPLWRS
jgi:hypothetical protein